MQYGYFDDAQREYVITRPDTPRPWCNYLGSAAFGGLITNNASGYVFNKSADQGRLTRFRFNAGSGDLCGRYLYLRDRDNGQYWSHTWMPVCPDLDSFESQCRHGAGYTIIDSKYDGIRSETRHFVPKGALYEVCKIKLTNESGRARRITLFPSIEPQCNWNATDDTKNLQYNQYIALTSCVDGIIDIASNVNMPEDAANFTNKDQKRHTFFALAGAQPSGFDADYNAFIGPYGNYSRPLAVSGGQCSGATAYGDLPYAAFHVDLELQPGQTCVLATVFGVGPAATSGAAARAAMTGEAAIDAALAEVRAWWHGRLNTLSANTPDPAFNSMLNMWAPFNNLMTFYWSRAASLVYAGERDGLGYRDSLQDIVGAAALVTDEVSERLQLLITGQFSNGGCKPVVQPFNHHPGKETLPVHFRSDDALWLFNAVPAFVAETGDLGFYRKVLPFADKGAASVFGHLRKALDFSIERSGAHGLPCGLDADWNDCLRLGEKGESVFVAMQLRYGLLEYIRIARLLDEPTQADWAVAELAQLDERLQAHAWDGDWFLRAYRYDGLKFGSRECTEGRIFMNPQVWAILSGHSQGESAATLLDAMDRELLTDYGLMLCTPPYVSTDPQVCLARLFNPGTKENGGIFNHCQGWAVLAAAALGLGDRAFGYLRRVLPASFNDCAEVREVEPYVVCQSTHSTFSQRYGAGRLSWLSGSAVWNYVAMTSGILGIQPTEAGLRINPCIPANWSGFTATRSFRGATYHITVENPDGAQSGLRHLTVNGQPVNGNLLPIAPTGTSVEVRALI